MEEKWGTFFNRDFLVNGGLEHQDLQQKEHNNIIIHKFGSFSRVTCVCVLSKIMSDQ